MIRGIVAWLQEYQDVLQWLAGVSVVMFVFSVIVFPLVIVFLPTDYFIHDRRDPARRLRRHPAVWLTVMVVKNAAGAILVMAGLVMLVLPGQGLLTILIGLTLLNFPGKYTLERRLVSRPAVARALNRIRRAAGRAPLEIPDAESGSSRRAL